MTKRRVKTPAAALSRTNAAIVADGGLENVVAGLGTARDKRSYNTYTLPTTMDRAQLEAMYRSSWLAKRIVNSVADDMTREWFDVSFDDEDPENAKAVERGEKRLQIPKKINTALKWARLYGGSVAILGIGDQDLSTPLDIETVKEGDLRYIHVLDRWRAWCSPTMCTDLGSQHFGKPDYYVLAESSVQVHHTRVLRFNGQELPYFLWQSNSRWDDSELQHVVEALKDHDQTTAGIATMMFEANIDVITSEGLNTTLASKDGEKLVTKRYQLSQLMKSMNRTLLLDGKEKYEKKSNSFANLDKVLEKFQIEVCGAADIPMTRLFGQSPGGLNSTGDGDIRNYYDMVSAKQEAEMRPQLEYLYAILCRSELGYTPDDLELTFKALWQVSATEQAAIDYQRAQTDQIYLTEGVLHEANVGKSLKARGTYPELTDEDIEMLQELVDNPPPPPAPPVVQALPGQTLPPAPGETKVPKPETDSAKTVPAEA